MYRDPEAKEDMAEQRKMTFGVAGELVRAKIGKAGFASKGLISSDKKIGIFRQYEVTEGC